MKLTINHLKGYLGTGLKILDLTTKTSFDLDKFYNQEIPIEFQNKYGKIGLEQVINDNQLLPLLHPLSSITKYREDLGFVPIDEIKPSQHHLFFREDLEFPMDGLQYSEIKKLQQWHIDYQNLIGENLAIEIK